MSVTKTKMLCIVQLPPPWHGVSVMNANVINNPLLATNYDTRVLHMYFGQTLNDLGTVNARKLVYFFLFFLRMFRELVFRRPDIVYFTFMPRGINLYRDTAICLFIKLFGYKPLVHLHGRGIKEFAAGSGFKRFLFRIAFRGTRLISLSPLLTADVATVYKDRPLVLPNGIDAPRFAFAESQPADVPVILFFTNLFVAKGIFDFLAMLKTLHSEGLPFRSVIAGGNGDVTREQVTDYCTEAGFADQVTLLGSVTGNSKWAVFQQADIFVLPSHNECFPLTVLEAMSAALPVVVTCIGGTPDIILPGETGYLVEQQAPEALAAAVRTLLTDATLRRNMSQRSLQRFQDLYTLEKFQQGFVTMLDQIRAEK